MFKKFDLENMSDKFVIEIMKRKYKIDINDYDEMIDLKFELDNALITLSRKVMSMESDNAVLTDKLKHYSKTHKNGERYYIDSAIHENKEMIRMLKRSRRRKRHERHALGYQIDKIIEEKYLR